jgi:FMN phosphatase YigB (HAD superfamily)
MVVSGHRQFASAGKPAALVRPPEHDRASERVHDLGRRLDAILFDIGGTLVAESPPGTAVHDLVTRLLPGVASDLGVLGRVVRLGAATNTALMSEANVRELLGQAGIEHFFEVLTTSSDVGVAKPDPTVLLVTMARMGLHEASRILYVGDRDIDREAATAAGMAFALVNDEGLVSSVLAWAASREI